MVSSKITVAVLFGGVSSEHEVSRLSVTSVLEHLNRAKYSVMPVGITKDGRWFRYDGDPALIADGRWERTGQITPVVLTPSPELHGFLVRDEQGWRVHPIDVVFPVLHGKNGEDGTVQGLMDLARIPYVGCGVMASANCMDKVTSKKIFIDAGIPVARSVALHRSEMDDFGAVSVRVETALGYPVFVKPANAGSSVGVSKAVDSASLKAALEEAFRHDRKVLIEEAIVGAEVECGVMGNYENAEASSVLGEIVPVRDLYDYDGKYIDGSTELFIPARIPEAQTALLRETAVRAYRAMDCAGLARVDFFARPDGSIILNEINTMPGFTNISMFPKLFMQSGYDYSGILDRLISLAMEEHA